MLRFENVGLRYGDRPEVFSDVSLHIPPGSFQFILGPSGAGKSSLLRMMFLATRPSRGRLHVFGKDASTLSREQIAEFRRRIGVVFQEFRLLDHLTALENVALPLKVMGRHDRRVDAHVMELLSWVGLKDHVHAFPPTLSGGQQQRVAIARAVIAQPSLLVADEPTGNVDDKIGLRLLHLFEELNRLGTTVVVATHSGSLAEGSGHPVARLAEGRLEPPEDPASLQTGDSRRSLMR